MNRWYVSLMMIQLHHIINELSQNLRGASGPTLNIMEKIPPRISSPFILLSQLKKIANKWSNLSWSVRTPTHTTQILLNVLHWKLKKASWHLGGMRCLFLWNLQHKALVTERVFRATRTITFSLSWSRREAMHFIFPCCGKILWHVCYFPQIVGRNCFKPLGYLSQMFSLILK